MNVLKINITLLLIAGSIYSQAQPLLWKISGKDLEQNSYLFGTHHDIHPVFLDSIAGFYNALNNVDLLITEKNYDEMNKRATRTPPADIKMPSDTSYKDVLSAENLTILDSVLHKNMNVGYEEMYLKPIFLSVILPSYQYKQYLKDNPSILENDPLLEHPSIGIDVHLQGISKEKGIENIGLELFEDSETEKIEKGLSIRESAEMLMQNIKISSVIINFRIDLNKAYRKQDLDQLKPYFLDVPNELDDITKNYMYEIGAGRNIKWMKKIPSLIQAKKSFIAVGVAHLMGEDGLISLLRKNGYIVTPVTE